MTTAVITHRIARSSRLAAVALVVAAAALTAVASQGRIHLGFTPVPITGQTFAVLLTGAALGWRLGAAGQLLYVAAGIAGAPVFSDGRSGWEVMTGATGGYIVGFAFAAALIGRAAERGHDRRFGSMALAFLAGSAVIYVFGVTGLMASTGMTPGDAIARGVAPFVMGDLVKAVAAGVLLPGAWKVLDGRR
jgi:biotin transport system substrate-specific component